MKMSEIRSLDHPVKSSKDLHIWEDKSPDAVHDLIVLVDELSDTLRNLGAFVPDILELEKVKMLLKQVDE
jgi:hypothetical protein